MTAAVVKSGAVPAALLYVGCSSQHCTVGLSEVHPAGTLMPTVGFMNMDGWQHAGHMPVTHTQRVW